MGITAESGTIGSLANLATGLIQGSTYDGIQNVSGTITTIDNHGVVKSLGRTGIRNEEYFGNAHIGTITNRAGASVSGADYGIAILDNATGGTATIDSISNSGTVSGGVIGVVVYGYPSTLGSLDNSGRIEGGTRYGVQVDGGTITTLTNSGTIVGDWNGVRTDYNATILTITNGTTGTIQGTQYDGIINAGGEMTTIDNSGVIDGPGRAGILIVDYLVNAHVGTITNRAGGSISGGQQGIYNQQAFGNTSTIDLIANSGTVSGGDVGVENLGGSIGTLTNQAGGVVTGAGYYGVYVNGGTVATLSNAGTLQGGLTGVYNTGVVTTVSNSGSITGGSSQGLQNVGGVIRGITNTGTINSIGNSGGTIGTGTGLAISSTGAGATIGDLYNQGTINGGVTVANQDLQVHGNTSPMFGVFQNGTITVTNGSLTFVDGSTYLDSDVVVSSAGGVAGLGTMTNQGELILGETRLLDGAFAQTSTGVFIALLSDVSTYGSLVATGSASFDGILNLEQAGLSLAGGQTFNLFSFASVFGNFSGLAVDGTLLTSLGGGQWSYGSLILTETLTATSLSISVTATAVPEIDPQSFGGAVSLLIGALSLVEQRIRRRRAAAGTTG